MTARPIIVKYRDLQDIFEGGKDKTYHAFLIGENEEYSWLYHPKTYWTSGFIDICKACYARRCDDIKFNHYKPTGDSLWINITHDGVVKLFKELDEYAKKNNKKYCWSKPDDY